MDDPARIRILLEAEGYFELGMVDDAVRVVTALPPGDQSRNDVLALRLALHMTAKHWPAAAEIAACLVEREPQESGWWVNLAYSARRARSLEEAESILLRAAELHPANAIIHYNLACYACVTGRLELAKERLSQARKLDKGVEEIARNDDDLAALRDWIGAEG